MIAVTDRGIARVILRPTKRELDSVQDTAHSKSDASKARKHVRRLQKQLTRYFAGEAVRFDVPLDLSAGTAFQRAVWRACARIPYGETRSYGELAQMAGRPGAARAVGGAMHANPLSILVPCHRVIRSDGSLGGFGLGISLKKKLLRLEQHCVADGRTVGAAAGRPYERPHRAERFDRCGERPRT
ncbi:MAG: methylated-DNA--[protein]-cysteine S-methyltransferase [Planctomycetota bacterium]